MRRTQATAAKLIRPATARTATFIHTAARGTEIPNITQYSGRRDQSIDACCKSGTRRVSANDGWSTQPLVAAIQSESPNKLSALHANRYAVGGKVELETLLGRMEMDDHPILILHGENGA